MGSFYFSTTVDANGPTTGDTWTDTNYSYGYSGWHQDPPTLPVSRDAAERRARLEALGIDADAIDRAVDAHQAWLDMMDWLWLSFPAAARPLPEGRRVPCAAQRRCPARRPLARVSRAPIVAYRADAR